MTERTSTIQILPNRSYGGKNQQKTPKQTPTSHSSKKVKFKTFQCFEIAVGSRQSDRFLSQVGEQKLCFAQGGTTAKACFIHIPSFRRALPPFYQTLKLSQGKKCVLPYLCLSFPNKSCSIIDNYWHFPKDQPHPWGSVDWHLTCCRKAMRIWLSCFTEMVIYNCGTNHKLKTSKKKLQTEIKPFRWFQSVVQDKNSDKRSSKALRKKIKANKKTAI